MTDRQKIAGRYQLVELLGQGGMGRVWRAYDEVLHREVALKELLLPDAVTGTERKAARTRALREARTAAQLDHRNIVRVHDVVLGGEDPWVVMELVRSRSLAGLLREEGPIDPHRAGSIGLDVLAAIMAAHQAGVLHRDIKPANVLLAEDGRAVLTDFGLAIGEGDPRITQSGLIMGSPSYLAPEWATDGSIGPAADLWSLGATLYTAVEGHPPYARSTPVATIAALAVEPPPPPQRAGMLGPALTGLLRRDPAQRISAEIAAELLTRAAQDGAHEQSWVTVPGAQRTVVRMLYPPSTASRDDTTPASTPTPADAASADELIPAGVDIHEPITATDADSDNNLDKSWRLPRRAATGLVAAAAVLAASLLSLAGFRADDPQASENPGPDLAVRPLTPVVPATGTAQPVPTTPPPTPGPALSSQAGGGPRSAPQAQPPPSPPTKTTTAVPGRAIIGIGSSRCIDAQSSNASGGVQLRLWDCTGAARQRWTFPADGTVRSMGKCLTAASGQRRTGQRSCSPAAPAAPPKGSS
ncbi:serine/threonine-protein kinase [Micromonospora sp. CB01531]|uniref:serine/threonine-protein kinase n=1 Tax=Micromonospora sp. CB01531 TaxID=1718947 RepID=UPI00093F55BA|nr:serine/threonine-protein kinase [Micromonospora sp. CB01531]OKI49280.1 hypothetical protein A6A27_35195 [Micromonospora sp. CB01531]